jgi:hypothetical protein
MDSETTSRVAVSALIMICLTLAGAILGAGAGALWIKKGHRPVPPGQIPLCRSSSFTYVLFAFSLDELNAAFNIFQAGGV